MSVVDAPEFMSNKYFDGVYNRSIRIKNRFFFCHFTLKFNGKFQLSRENNEKVQVDNNFIIGIFAKCANQNPFYSIREVLVREMMQHHTIGIKPLLSSRVVIRHYF